MMLGDANSDVAAAGALTRATDAINVLTDKMDSTPLGMVINGAVVLGVNRNRHPVIWWLFGAVPLAMRTYRAVSK